MSTVDAGGGVFIGSSADGFGSNLPWTGTPIFSNVIIAFPGITFSGAATLTPGLVNAGTSACSGTTFSLGTCPKSTSDEILLTGCTTAVTANTTGAQFDCALTTAESNQILGWLNGSDNTGTHSLWPMLEGAVTITTPNGAATTQNAFVLITPTPEPSCLVLLIGGISAIGFRIQKRNTAV